MDQLAAAETFHFVDELAARLKGNAPDSRRLRQVARLTIAEAIAARGTINLVRSLPGANPTL
jgi:hypothetical protein